VWGIIIFIRYCHGFRNTVQEVKLHLSLTASLAIAKLELLVRLSTPQLFSQVKPAVLILKYRSHPFPLSVSGTHTHPYDD